MDNSEFYIGWQAKAPDGFARHVRRVLLLLIVLVLAAGLLLALQQRKFSASAFEYGQLTEISGVYQQFPVPSIKVITHKDAFGNTSFITMPLVGYGKFGAEGTIAAIEKEQGISLDKKEVTLKGTLIYSDGKTILQVDKNDDPLVKVNKAVEENNSPVLKELGTVQLTGEILDPKCYFGAMKPGHGKPHRDCAIRCVAGGISPVFYVMNEKGESNYYLILDERGVKMNSLLTDYIAEPVSLQGRAVQFDDWVLLYVKPETIKRTGGLSLFKMNSGTVSCKPTSPR
jgi:hypothetical protein